MVLKACCPVRRQLFVDTYERLHRAVRGWQRLAVRICEGMRRLQWKSPVTRSMHKVLSVWTHKADKVLPCANKWRKLKAFSELRCAEMYAKVVAASLHKPIGNAMINGQEEGVDVAPQLYL